MSDDSLRTFVAGHRHGVVTTLKRDGRPQLSNVTYTCADGRVRVSITDGRAKTANLRRDPRISMHVTTPDFWPYAVVEGTAALSAVASSTDDATVDELIEIYRAVAGEHDDWAEFRQAMVEEGRLVLSFDIERAYGTA